MEIKCVISCNEGSISVMLQYGNQKSDSYLQSTGNHVPQAS